MVNVVGPKFRSAKIYPNRKLKFDLDRDLPFIRKAVVFRKKGIAVRKRGVSFGNRGVTNIELSAKEDPNSLNNEGIKFYKMGKYKTALKYFDKAIAVAPRFAMAKQNRIHCIKMLARKRELARQKDINITTPQTETVYKRPFLTRQNVQTQQRYSQPNQYFYSKNDKIPRFSYTQYHDMHQIDWDKLKRKGY